MSRVVHTNIWSAYGYARKAGYEGTEEEFEQGLKKSAEAAGNAEESAYTASESATEADAARDAAAQSAESASTSEGNALEYANSAAQVLMDAQAVAQTVNAKATEAAGSASRAENYAQTATTKASEAATAAGTATTAATSASGSAQAADASATAAAASETNAAASASSASTSAGSASESADDAAESAAAAQAVKDSIPADYSQLSADVTDLKSDLEALEGYTGIIEDYVPLCVTSGAIRASDGAPYANSIQITDNYKYSPFIPIKSGEKIEYKLRTPSTYCMIAFYTTNQTSGYVSGSSVVGTGGDTSGTFTAPSNGYIRITSRNDLADKYAIYTIDGEIKALADRVSTIEDTLENEGYVKAVSISLVENEYVNQFNGAFTAYNGWDRTGYILTPLTANLSVKNVTKASIYNYFYKADYSPLSRFDLVIGNNTIAIPSGAAYYVLSTSSADLKTVEVIDPKPYDDSVAIKALEDAVKALEEQEYLRFCSWNVGLFNNGLTAPSTAESADKMVDFRKIIGQIDAGILNADEFRQYFDAENTIDATTNVMDFKYPENTKSTQVSGNVSFSKYEISNVTKKTFDSGSGKYFIWFNVSIHGKTVTIINAHLAIEQDPTVHRAAEMQELITFMTGKSYVILSGDFNVASQSEYDVFKNAGYVLCNGGDFEWFNTWPIRANLPDGWQTTWPCENLDNIIVTENIVPQYVEAVTCNISDHAPLVAQLRFD